MNGFHAEVINGRKITSLLVWLCYVLLFFAAISPVIGYCDFRPKFETREVWFQRSGALTTILALLSTTVKDFASNILSASGFCSEAKVIVKGEFELRFVVIFAVGFFLTVIGTVVWGYGDTILNIIKSPESLAAIFEFKTWSRP
jgi:hypothetical protein